MRLEAGKGSAKIVDRNFIKQRWFTSDKVKAFFKGSFNHDSSDILKDFRPTNNVYQIVNSLNDFVENIRRTHARNTKRINDIISRYTDSYNTLTHIANHANNIQGVLKTTGNVVSDATNNTDYSSITVINPVAGQSVQIAQALRSAVKNLNQYGKVLSSIIINTKEDKIWTRRINHLQLDDAKDIINNASIKSEIEAIYGDVCWHKDHNIQVLDENQIPPIPKQDKRKILYLILKKAIEKQDSRYYNLSVESDFSNFDDDFKWGNLIDGIRFTEQQSNKKRISS